MCGCNEKHENQQQRLPPLWKQARNFIEAKIVQAMGFVRECDKEQVKERLSSCANCEKLVRINKLPLGADVSIGDRCGSCGCPVLDKAVMVGHRSWSCPDGRWDLIDKKYESQNEKK